MKIKKLKTDNGKEYVNRKLKNFLEDNGIVHKTIVPHIPQSNGRAERLNQTILSKIRCLLIESGLNKRYWVEAAQWAVFIINRTPCSSINFKSPQELWSGEITNLSNIKIFGCKTFVYINEKDRDKLSSRALECIFLGYDIHKKAYKVLDPKTNKIMPAKFIEFRENELPCKKQPDYFICELNKPKKNVKINKNTEPKQKSKNSEDFDITQEKETASDDSSYNDCSTQSTDDEFLSAENKSAQDLDQIFNRASPVLRRSSRKKVQTEKFIEYNKSKQRKVKKTKQSALVDTAIGGMCNESNEEEEEEEENLFVFASSLYSSIAEPQTFNEALKSEEKDQWIQAMKNEYEKVIQNKTWELVECPKNVNVIGSKWVYKKKSDQTYKARLVAKGYSQVYGLDYHDTFSPVVRFNSLRILFAYAAQKKLQILHYDAQSAFLHGELQEEIYMAQSQGFIQKGKENFVCKLKKSLYGLKQSGREWNKKLNSILTNLVLKQSNADQCIYYYMKDEIIFIIAVFVDDLIVFHNDLNLLNKVKNKLFSEIDMKDLGNLKRCFGIDIEVNSNEGVIKLNQSKYIDQILKRFNMADCNPLSTPMEVSVSKTDTNEKDLELSQIPYQNAVGAIMYLYQATRPDLAYAISTLSRYNKSYTNTHWRQVKRVLRYLKGTRDLTLTYKHSSVLDIKGYADASWASDKEDSKSITGYVFTINNTAISWNTKKQQTVALSSTEAEYQALVAATQEAMWLNNLAQELKMKKKDPIEIFDDSMGAIDLATNNNFSSKTKHIRIKMHFMQEKILNQEVKISYISTQDMKADSLTKPLPSVKIEKFRKEINLI